MSESARGADGDASMPGEGGLGVESPGAQQCSRGDTNSDDGGVIGADLTARTDRVPALSAVLTETRVDILSAFATSGNLTPKHVAAHVDISQPYARGEVSALADAGLIEAVPPADLDGLYRITRLGLAVTKHSDQLHDRAVDAGSTARPVAYSRIVTGEMVTRIIDTARDLEYTPSNQHA